MRDAESIVLEKSGVLIAARKMKELGISSLFVTKKSGELLGIVTIENVSSMIRQRKEDLETIIDKNIETVGLDASIDEIIPLFLNTKYPVAVLDEDNKLKGIIFKSTILAGIAGEGGNNDATHC
jgi:glycine betaine/proline transport system ATP-binding protein